MAVLSTIFSAVSEIKAPSGLWQWLILSVFSFIENYGVRVLVFTLLLKLLLSPLDIFQRVKARKNQKITERLKPDLEKLQKQYPDKTQFSQKQMELNKKEGYSYFSACLPAILTMVIFITLLQGLNSISQYMNFKEYHELWETYHIEYTIAEEKGMDVDDATEYAQDAVVKKYDEIKVSFLWIKNIWSPDVPWKKPINDRDAWKSNAGKYATDITKSGMDKVEFDNMISEYSIVMKKLYNDESNKTNGILVLPILSLGLSIAQQLLSRRQQKQTGQDNMAGGGSMKIMMWIFPIMIGFFSLQYTAAFSIYLVTSYAVGLLITLSANLLFFITDKRDKNDKENNVQKYGRPDPNDL